MAKLKSIDSKAIEQFRAVLKYWHTAQGIQIQQSAARLGISHTLMSRLLHGKTGISLPQAENIATEMGKELVDVLIEGRKLIGGSQTKKEFLDPHKEAKEAFSFILLQGGELAEEFAERAIAIAKKKKTEVVFKPTSTLPLSKSA